MSSKKGQLYRKNKRLNKKAERALAKAWAALKRYNKKQPKFEPFTVWEYKKK